MNTPFGALRFFLLPISLFFLVNAFFTAENLAWPFWQLVGEIVLGGLGFLWVYQFFRHKNDFKTQFGPLAYSQAVSRFGYPGVAIIAAVVVAIGVLAFLSPLVDYITSEFGVTNKRVITKVGLLRRRTLELLLRHVEAISVDQSVSGRILNYGSVTLTGTGGVREVFDNISKPLEFRRRIQGEASYESRGIRP